MKTDLTLLFCALVSWGAIAGYLFLLHRKVTRLEKK